MKKKIRSILLFSNILFYLIFLFSCKKDKTETIPDETAFSNILADSTYTIRVSQLNSPKIYEFGIRFSPSIKGVVTKLGCKLPKKGVYRMCLWNVNDKMLLVETTVNQITSELTWQAITKTNIEVGKSYYITVTADNWYDAYPKSTNNVSYPIIRDNIQLQAFGYVQNFVGASSKIPTLEDNKTSISGIIDFGFQTN
jgi:hypothetical protein